jgi:putative ABC transport system permease protein
MNLGEPIWIASQWFYVVGILEPATLIDSSLLLGSRPPSATSASTGTRATICVRSLTEHVDAVHSVLAATANPDGPSEVNVTESRFVRDVFRHIVDQLGRSS